VFIGRTGEVEMRIYIAGPYTFPDPETNTANAIACGDKVAALGHTVFIPHLTHFWHSQIPHDYEFWMAHDMQWLACCNAILRLPGESGGADREIEFARKRKMLIYYSIDEIPTN
jgi:hypothetical protein